MMNTLTYKDYIGSVNFSEKDTKWETLENTFKFK